MYMVRLILDESSQLHYICNVDGSYAIQPLAHQKKNDIECLLLSSDALSDIKDKDERKIATIVLTKNISRFYEIHSPLSTKDKAFLAALWTASVVSYLLSLYTNA